MYGYWAVSPGSKEVGDSLRLLGVVDGLPFGDKKGGSFAGWASVKRRLPNGLS